MVARWSASSVRTGFTNGSSARARTARSSSTKASRPSRARTMPSCARASPRAARDSRFRIPSAGFATSVSPQSDAGRTPVFGEELRERDRRFEVDHRSPRSWANSSSSSRSGAIGALAGASVDGIAGGEIHPRRTASASCASASSSAWPACGGDESATTRSRSVTSTVSPPATSRTYSLSLFLRTFRPIARIQK